MTNLMFSMKFSDTELAVGYSCEFSKAKGEVLIKNFLFYMFRTPIQFNMQSLD